MESILTPSEIEALLKSTIATDPVKVVKPIDLVARDHQAFALLPRLHAAADRFALQVARTATQQLRTACKPSGTTVEVVPGPRLQEFIGAPRFAYGITISGCQGAGLISIEGALGDSFVERQFGGEPSGKVVQGGPLTPTSTERRTVSRLAAILVGALTATMTRVASLEGTLESDPPAMLKDPGRAVAAVLIMVRLAMGEQRSTVAVALDTAAAGFKIAEAEAPVAALSAPPLLPGLQRVTVNLTAVLGTAQIAMQRLMALRPGDVLALGTPVDAEVPLLIEGHAKLTGVPAIHRGNLSLQISGPIKE